MIRRKIKKAKAARPPKKLILIIVVPTLFNSLLPLEKIFKGIPIVPSSKNKSSNNKSNKNPLVIIIGYKNLTKINSLFYN